MRMASVVPAGTWTSAGVTAAGAASGGAEAVAGCVAGAPGATAGVLDGTAEDLVAGVTVVVTVGPVCPGAGGWMVVVVTLPSLSAVMTCCGCPVAMAFFFASSMAASCLDWHPMNKLNASTVAAAGLSLWGVIMILGPSSFVRFKN